MNRLEVKKVYIDTRFKTLESNTDSEFTIQLPRTWTIPDDTVCYIDDVCIPVSWSTVGDKSNIIYVNVTFDTVAFTFL